MAELLEVMDASAPLDSGPALTRGRTLEPLETGVEAASVTDWVTLTKPRIGMMAAVAAAAGYLMGAEAIDPLVLTALVVGSWLAAAGSSALNMVWERDLDRRMHRTAKRPLAAGRLRVGPAIALGLAALAVGSAVLALGTGWLPAAVALASFAGYLFVYTPLKTRTSLNTVVGAIPGALPPVIGWAAARGDLSGGVWLLFALLFLWQIPHFLAIAWIYREDYARADMKMLPVLDSDGLMTGRQMVLYTLAMIAASAAPTLTGMSGLVYLAGALAAGGLFLWPCVHFAIAPGHKHAKQVFLASLLYLPVVYALLVIDKI